MSIQKSLWASAALLGLCGVATAQDGAWSTLSASPTRVYANVSSQGLGGGLAKSLNQHVDLRVGLSTLNFKQSSTGESMKTDVALQLQNLGLYADFFPFASSGLRLTAGMQMGNNKIDITGKPDDGQISVGKGKYNVGAADGITGKLDMGSTAPYLGIGYSQHGPSKTGLSLNFDLGVRMGKANVTLTRNGFATLPTDQLKNLDADLATETTKLSDKLGVLKTYPVIGLGLSYRW